MTYIAFVHKEDDVYIATIPDLDYLSAKGYRFEDAVAHVIAKAELHCEALDKLPTASEYEELLKTAKVHKDDIPQIVALKVEKNVRINMMLPKDLLELADKRAKEDFGGNRSAYVQSLIRQDTQSSS